MLTNVEVNYNGASLMKARCRQRENGNERPLSRRLIFGGLLFSHWVRSSVHGKNRVHMTHMVGFAPDAYVYKD